MATNSYPAKVASTVNVLAGSYSSRGGDRGRLRPEQSRFCFWRLINQATVAAEENSRAGKTTTATNKKAAAVAQHAGT